MFRTKILVFVSLLFLPLFIAPPQFITAQTEGYDPVVRIAWNNDGSLLAVGYHSGILEIRDGETGNIIFSDDSRSELFDFDWSPDNERLVLSQSEDMYSTSISIYNILTRTVETSFEPPGHSRQVRMSLDGLKIATIYGSLSEGWWTSSSSHGVNIWELTSNGYEITSSFTRAVGTMAWGTDSTSIAISDSWKYGTKIFDIVTDEEIALLADSGSFALESSPDGTMIASRGNNDELSIYETNSYQELNQFSIFSTSSGNIAWSADNQQIVVIGGQNEDGNLFVYDIQTGQPTFTIVDESITAVDWSPDGTKIAYGGDRLFEIIDAPNFDQSSDIQPDYPVGIEWNYDGTLVAVGYNSGILQVHDGTSGDLIYGEIDRPSLSGLAWSPDSNLLALAQGESFSTNRVSIYNVSTRTVVSSEEVNGQYIDEIVWSSDGTLVAVTVSENLTDWGWSHLIVWTVTEDRLTTPQYYDNAFGTLDWRPNSHQLASGTVMGGGVVVIDGSNGHSVSYIDGAATYEVRYSPDGSQLAILDIDFNLTIYDADTFQEQQRAEIGIGNSISWSPDGQQIAFVKYEDDTQTLMVYDLPTEQLSELFIDESLGGAAWSPDGNQIAVQINHELHLIDAPTNE